MVTRVSLVKLRAEVPREKVLEHWLGPHADVVCAMPEVSEYVVALAKGPREQASWDAVATLRFGSLEDLHAALDDPVNASELARTRIPFVQRVDAFLVDEHTLIDRRTRP